MKNGLFITLEGGEGTGKSTQSARLAQRLRALGRAVVLTREPGGTPQGEAVRNLLVAGETGNWSANAEAMLMSAARVAHVANVIVPALSAGKLVVCDRFIDSTRVYQGFAGGADNELVSTLERVAGQGLMPDLTLVFDMQPEDGLVRAGQRGNDTEDRFERKGMAFHRKLRDGFLKIALAEPARCKIIDAARPIDDVTAQCWAEIEVLIRG